MHLEIPEGTNVQIIVGRPAPLALTDETDDAHRSQSTGRPILKSLSAALVLSGSFFAGAYFGGHATGTQLAAGAVSTPRLSPTNEQHAFPDAPLPNPQPQQQPQAAVSGQVPPEFRNQLRQQPTVTLPPGQTSDKNPFGLEQ
jgi:hypothetical protein